MYVVTHHVTVFRPYKTDDISYHEMFPDMHLRFRMVMEGIREVNVVSRASVVIGSYFPSSLTPSLYYFYFG